MITDRSGVGARPLPFAFIRVHSWSSAAFSAIRDPQSVTRHRAWLAAILALGLALRVACFVGYGGGDDVHYVEAARALLDGRLPALTGPPDQYPLRLPLSALNALPIALFGAAPAALAGLHHLAYLVTALLLFSLGRSLGGVKAGLWAALALSFFAPLAASYQALLTDDFTFLMAALCAWLLLASLKQPTRAGRCALAAGFTFAMLCAARENHVFWAPALLLPLAARLTPKRRYLLGLVVGGSLWVATESVVFWALEGDPLLRFHHARAFDEYRRHIYATRAAQLAEHRGENDAPMLTAKYADRESARRRRFFDPGGMRPALTFKHAAIWTALSLAAFLALAVSERSKAALVLFGLGAWGVVQGGFTAGFVFLPINLRYLLTAYLPWFLLIGLACGSVSALQRRRQRGFQLVTLAVAGMGVLGTVLVSWSNRGFQEALDAVKAAADKLPEGAPLVVAADHRLAHALDATDWLGGRGRVVAVFDRSPLPPAIPAEARFFVRSRRSAQLMARWRATELPDWLADPNWRPEGFRIRLVEEYPGRAGGDILPLTTQRFAMLYERVTPGQESPP